eukprot:4315551-Prymnesium_polylepis.1
MCSVQSDSAVDAACRRGKSSVTRSTPRDGQQLGPRAVEAATPRGPECACGGGRAAAHAARASSHQRATGAATAKSRAGRGAGCAACVACCVSSDGADRPCAGRAAHALRPGGSAAKGWGSSVGARAARVLRGGLCGRRGWWRRAPARARSGGSGGPRVEAYGAARGGGAC